MKGQKLLSIVVPVYNVDMFLTECLDSIIPQLDSNIELIIVDDGSTDASPGILRKYKEDYPSLVLVRQENGGLSAARNTGLKIASGDYIWFIDSDDYISSDAVYRVCQVISEASENDIIRFGFNLFDSDTGSITETVKYNAVNDVIAYEYFSENAMMYQAWSGVYKMEFLKKQNLTFPEGKIFEDVPFNLVAYSTNAHLSVLSDVLYWYRIRPGSLLRSGVTKKKVDSLAYILRICDKIIKENAGEKKRSALAVTKKFDYLYSYLDHLLACNEISEKEKYICFRKNNLHIPIHTNDSLGLMYNKLLLRFLPSVFYKKRQKQLISNE